MGFKTLLRKLTKRKAPLTDRESSSTIAAHFCPPVASNTSAESDTTRFDTDATLEQTDLSPNGCGTLSNALSTLAFAKKLPLHELRMIGRELDFPAVKHETIEYKNISERSASVSVQSRSMTPLLGRPSYDSLPSVSSQPQRSSSSTTSYVSVYERTPPTSPLLGQRSAQQKSLSNDDTASVASRDLEIIPLLLPPLADISPRSSLSRSHSLSGQTLSPSDTHDEIHAPNSPETRADFIALVRLPYLQNIALSAISKTDPDPAASALLFELDAELDCDPADTYHAYCDCELRSLGTHKFRTRGLTEKEKRVIKRGKEILYLQSVAAYARKHSGTSNAKEDLGAEDLETITRQLFPATTKGEVLSDKAFRAFLGKLVYWGAIDHLARNRLVNLQVCFDECVGEDEEGVGWCAKVEYLCAGPPPVSHEGNSDEGIGGWVLRSDDEFWGLGEWEDSVDGGGDGEMGGMGSRSFESDPDIF